MPSDSSSRKIDQLIKVLSDGTENHTIQWATTADEDAFRFASTTANVLIERYVHRNQVAESTTTRRTLRVLNRQGRLVEEYCPEDSLQVRQFDTLYGLARRSAYKTDDLLDALLMEIKLEGV